MVPRRWRGLGLAAALLLASCGARAVDGFEWKDAGGTALAFGQASSWPRGEEGIFSGARKANRYSLRKGFTVPAGTGLIIGLKREGQGGREAGVELSAWAAARSDPALAAASFPLLADRVLICLPLEAGARFGSLGVVSTRPESGFAIESLAFGPIFRGIETGAAQLRISSGFSLQKSQGFSEFSIDMPFVGLSSRKAEAADGLKPGVLLDYGPAPAKAVLRLEVVDSAGLIKNLNLRTQPGGTRTVLSPDMLPPEIAKLRLRAPEGLDIRAFYAGGLEGKDYELADLGRVLLAKDEGKEYRVYRWDLLPSVLIFDFKDYATQDSFLKRLAFFVEKTGFRGRLAKDEEIASLHGWNAHDYRAEDLASFFLSAKEKAFPLGKAERELEAILLREGLILESGQKVEAGRGAMIAISRESSEALRWTFAVHESTHAIFFSDSDYRSFARGLWASLDKKEKWFWTSYLGWAGYDVGSDYLMGNEFQAYLLQQPTAAAEEYFTKRKTAELLEKHPELADRVAEYMAEYGSAFAHRAQELEAWLNKKYGIEAGRTVFLTGRPQ